MLQSVLPQSFAVSPALFDIMSNPTTFRCLASKPFIKGDSRLRLLNYQNNLISKITNLANLPNLIFLDLYNNLIDTLEGPLSTMSALRVVMVGKNRIEKVTTTDAG